MKQTIRYNTFETNSSSYHSLSIQKIKDKNIQEIEKGKDLTINTTINYKTIGDTESYEFIGRGSYNKAKMVLRFMGYELDNQLENIVDEKLYTNADDTWDYDKRNELLKANFYNIPLIQGFVKAIKRYIGEDRNVTIEFTSNTDPYIERVDDEEKSLCDIFNINEEDYQNVDKLADTFYNVIFDNNIEMIEECESNE